MPDSGTERVVRAKVTSYLHPDGSFRIATRGQAVRLAASDLARFDASESIAPTPLESPRAALSQEPPRGGRYATRAAWAGYAQGVGIEISDNQAMKDIIAAVDAWKAAE